MHFFLSETTKEKRPKIFHGSRKKITEVGECSHAVASENDVTDTDNATVDDVDMTVSLANKSASEKNKNNCYS